MARSEPPGVVDASAATSGNIPGSRGIVQLAGTAMTCNVDTLKSAALQSHTLLSALVRHEQTVYMQASQSAACMAAHNGEGDIPSLLAGARRGWRSSSHVVGENKEAHLRPHPFDRARQKVSGAHPNGCSGVWASDAQVGARSGRSRMASRKASCSHI
jgi:hypothetical protein